MWASVVVVELRFASTEGMVEDGTVVGDTS